MKISRKQTKSYKDRNAQGKGGWSKHKMEIKAEAITLR